MKPELEALLISKSASLPSPSNVAIRIVELANDPQTTIADVAKVISIDPALTTKVLRIVNSAMYARPRAVENLQQALVILGLNATVSLALSFSLVLSLRDQGGGGLDHNRYWRRSLTAGLAARAIGEAVGESDLEALFLAALLQDIGMLALDRVDPSLYREIDMGKSSHEAVRRREFQQLGHDHSEIGAWLLRQWKLPERTALAVQASHSAVSGPIPISAGRFARCVALSGLVADIFEDGEGGRSGVEINALADSLLRHGSVRLQEVLERVTDLIPAVEALFDIQLMRGSNPLVILDQAREALLTRNLHALQAIDRLQETTAELEERTSKLEEAYRHDPLTGIHNRRYFENYIDAALRHACRSEHRLSLILAELADFGGARDQDPAEANDLLKQTADIIKEVCPGDIVARFSEDRFAVVLPGAAAREAQTLAAQITDSFRHKVAAPLEGKTRPVLNVAAATHGDELQCERVTDLVNAVDQALRENRAQQGSSASQG